MPLASGISAGISSIISIGVSRDSAASGWKSTPVRLTFCDFPSRQIDSPIGRYRSWTPTSKRGARGM